MRRLKRDPAAAGLATGMKLYTSNRLEQLANQFSATLAKPLDSTVAGEIIVVQSRSMARWLSLQIAQRSNICMNCEFPFPRTFIGRILRVYFPRMASEEAFSVETMTWKISDLLAGLTLEKEFAPGKNYLNGGDDLKNVSIVRKNRPSFRPIPRYRPEMVMEWELDADQNDWQAILWKSLVGNGEPLHLARMLQVLRPGPQLSPWSLSKSKHFFIASNASN